MARTRRSLRPRWTRSKTQIFGVILVVLGAVQANMGLFSGWLTTETVGWIGSGIGALVCILRAFTTNSLTDKEVDRENRLIRKRTHKGIREQETESISSDS
jgi:4-hydroxybenzoate polyprenyltransferase